MPRNGSGTYSLPEPPFVAGTVISSAAVNDDLSDIGSALTASLPRDGQAGMTGQFKSTDGSTTLPGMSFSNDLNTGLYRPTDDQLAVVVGGVQVALFTSSGLQGAVPIGCILDFAGSTTPSLWVLCYGQNVPRTTYALLFAILGTTYGAGDGATTFGLPDLRGRTLYGKDNMGGVAASRLTTTYFGTDPTVLGNDGGSQNRILLTANLPAYTPTGTITINDTGHVHPINVGSTGGGSTQVTQGIAGVSGTVTGPVVNAVTGLNSSNVLFGGAAQGGTSTAFGLLSPALIMNKIIYAGA